MTLFKHLTQNISFKKYFSCLFVYLFFLLFLGQLQILKPEGSLNTQRCESLASEVPIEEWFRLSVNDVTDRRAAKDQKREPNTQKCYQSLMLCKPGTFPACSVSVKEWFILWHILDMYMDSGPRGFGSPWLSHVQRRVEKSHLPLLSKSLMGQYVGNTRS